MKKNNILKGIVKLIDIDEQDLREGMYVIIPTGTFTNEIVKIYKLGSVRSTKHDVTIEYSDSHVGIQMKSALRTLVVKDKGQFHLEHPIEQSQWEYAINEIGKEAEFVIESKIVKIIPKVDEAQERYERASNKLNKALSYIEYEDILEFLIKNLPLILKIAAGIEE